MNYIEQSKEKFKVGRVTSRVLDDLAYKAGYARVYSADRKSVERLTNRLFSHKMKILVNINGDETVFDSAQHVAVYLDSVLKDYDDLGISPN